MAVVKFVSSDGVETDVQCDNGISVMEVAIRAGIDGIDADCGGQLSCATCHVYVPQEWIDRLPAKSEDEDNLLDFAADRREGSRLCCQIFVDADLDGLVIEVPETQAR